MQPVLATLAGEIIVWVVWVAAGVVLLASGLAVILFSNPFFSALSLILNLGSLAILYLLISSEFVAAAQILVYAGAVMVMFLFVIGYLGGRADAPWAGTHRVGKVAAVIAAIAIAVEVVVAVGIDAGGQLSSSAQITEAFGSPRQIGELFLSDHLLAFEVTSIILFIGAIGGAVLGSSARRRDRAAAATDEQEQAAA
ncbi:MAG: NADH-quinone oxidoreductase subunit J [Thermoleophilia bacterium]